MRRLPAEWEPQRAVLLTWPHPDTDWAPRLAEVEEVYRQIALRIARRQLLLVVCRDHDHRAHVRGQLASVGVASQAVMLPIAPSNDTWARDYGPLTVVDDAGAARLVDFRFNGWGGKFPAALDDRIGAALHDGDRATDGLDSPLGSSAMERSRLVLEGGAIDTDGDGTLLALSLIHI